jgi:nitrate/nitrite-specific signal transduction histidine kinase
LRRTTVAVVTLTIADSLVLVALMTGAVLSPVNRLRRCAEAISADIVDLPPLPVGPPHDRRTLSRAMNGMVVTLSASDARPRRSPPSGPSRSRRAARSVAS